MRRWSRLTIAVSWFAFVSPAGAEDLVRSVDLAFTGSPAPNRTIAVTGAVGAARQAGLAEGDRVMSVRANGRDLTAKTQRTLDGRYILRHVPVTQVQLEVSRQGRTLALPPYSVSPLPKEDFGPTVEIIYGTLDGPHGYRLRTVIAKPSHSQGRLPAVLFVQWSSCDSVETVMNADDGWMRMIRDMSRQPFVFARTEKAGIGDSEGPECSQLDYETELRDHEAALAHLRTLPFVDPDRIVLFGASMGGTMAPIMASKTKTAGVIVFGTVAHTLAEHVVGYNRRALELDRNTPLDQVARLVNDQIEFHTEYMTRLRTPAEIARGDARLGTVWSQVRGAGGEIHNERPIAYHHQAQRRNWLEAWARIDAPVLVLYGEYDWIGDISDHQSIVDAVNRHHPGSARLVQIPGMDHHFSLYPSRHDAFTRTYQVIAPGPAVVAMIGWVRDLFLR